MREVTAGADHFALVEAFDFVNLGCSRVCADNNGIFADRAIRVNSGACEAKNMAQNTDFGGKIGTVTREASNIASCSTQEMSRNT